MLPTNLCPKWSGYSAPFPIKINVTLYPFIIAEHGTIETKKESSLEAPVVEAITKEQVHPLPNSAATATTLTTTPTSGTTIISPSSSTVSKMETFSASANVAALLGKPILQQQQQPQHPPDAKLPKTISDAIKPIG